MGSQTVHMSLSVRGALNWPKPLARKMARGVKHDDGRSYTLDEFRAWLMDALARGSEVIPMGECGDFDPKTGCRGHREEASAP